MTVAMPAARSNSRRPKIERNEVIVNAMHSATIHTTTKYFASSASPATTPLHNNARPSSLRIARASNSPSNVQTTGSNTVVLNVPAIPRKIGAVATVAPVRFAAPFPPP